MNRCYPNSLNPSTQIRFELQQPALVRIDVFTLRGQHVETLASAWREAGVHAVCWEARHARGAALPSDVYLVRLVVNNTVQTQKITFQ